MECFCFGAHRKIILDITLLDLLYLFYVLQSNLSMHTAGISYLHHHHNQQQQQQSSHPMPSGPTASHTLPAAPPAQQPLSSQVPASHSNSVVQVYSTLPHMAGGGSGGGGGGGGEIHTLGLQPFHPVLVSKAHCLLTLPSRRM